MKLLLNLYFQRNILYSKPLYFNHSRVSVFRSVKIFLLADFSNVFHARNSLLKHFFLLFPQMEKTIIECIIIYQILWYGIFFFKDLNLFTILGAHLPYSNKKIHPQAINKCVTYRAECKIQKIIIKTRWKYYLTKKSTFLRISPLCIKNHH